MQKQIEQFASVEESFKRLCMSISVSVNVKRGP